MEHSVDDKAKIIWINGSLIEERKANVSVFDHGLLTGDGVFETMISYQDVPFAFARHYKRLQNSASAFGLKVPDSDLLREACINVLKANNLFPSRLRITITGGPSPLGSEKGDAPENVIIASSIAPKQPETSSVITVPYPRNEHGALVGLKTTSYGENVIALAEAHSKGAREAIFGNVSGNLCEGTGSNIFVYYSGKLITPPLSSGCLAGVTRALVIEICKKLGIPVFEDNTELEFLEKVEFAFLTSTLREVQAIETVNGVMLPLVSSPIIKKIKCEFDRISTSDQDP